MNKTFGISAALTTPFRPDHSVDNSRLASHAASLLEEGCAGVTLFGTTGEGPSLGARERIDAQAALLDAGIAPDRITVAIGSSSSATAAEQADAALDAGIRSLLVTPPFYFKGVGDEGLFAWFAAFLERIGNRAPRAILYHIPQVTGVGLSIGLVRRLKAEFGEAVFAIKDSAGHWPTTTAFLEQKDIAILVGDERHLAAAARLGGAGAISGMANLFPLVLDDLVRTGDENEALNELVDALVSLPVTPAVKALVAAKRHDAEWMRVRAPLEQTPAADATRLKAMAAALASRKAA
ncbi:dihydrodipicolinate synthase family protein [Mesorhizobium microcysteis]|uniref:Dihydrodipicolinate synthase family protein n=1 Tax=Neoaquamicrobium microcysteis TaxID=2682781 RepID=A0A5D4GL55_9HYPH|nr:dihydrodipicolinate synthase family protein [Mesorhizobium microcysteis]TYR29571.1 dihydrodipicolinate synthase family protein [Mesorhizobium microcysteis]